MIRPEFPRLYRAKRSGFRAALDALQAFAAEQVGQAKPSELAALWAASARLEAVLRTMDAKQS